jgi:uncharacterized RDD family membrane protein YckC
MKTSTFRRLMPLIALMLCASTLIVHAHDATPDAAAITPAGGAPVANSPVAAAPAPATASTVAPPPAPPLPADESDSPDWESGDDQNDHHNGHRQHRWHSHHGNDVVSIGHDSNLEQGQQADSVVSIIGSSTSNGEVGDVVSILGNTRATGTVREGAVAVLGNTYVDAKVGGDVVAVLGNVELGPNAEVDGNVMAVGGKVLRDPAAIVHGDVQDVFAGNFGGLGWSSIWIQHCLFYGRPLALVPGLGWAWSLALTFLALYICLAWLFRAGLTQCVRTFETQPGHSVLAALIAMLLTPVLVVLLCITVIGIAAVPFVVLGLFCAGLFGKAVMLAWIGKRVGAERETGALNHPAFAVLIGGLIVLVLYVVPVLGFLVYKLLGFLGLGAVVYTLVLAARARQAAKHEGAPAGAPFGGSTGSASVAGNAAMRGGATTTSAAPSINPANYTVTPNGIAVPGGTAAPAGAVPGSAAALGGTGGAAAPGGAAPGGTAAPGGPAPGHSPAASPAPAPAPVTAALPRAGFWVRMAALLLDVLLIGFATSVLHPVFHLHLLVLAAYGAVMWKLRGSTIGGIVFDLRVVRLDGREIDWETSIIRALSCFLSLAVAGLGFFWIAFDDAHQAWHDKIAGTVVVRVAKGVPLV